MLTDEENKFVYWWEHNREKQKKIYYALAIGLPVGLLFGLPVLISLIFSDWYKNMIFISFSQLIVVIVAVFGIAVFYALFRAKHQWDMNEQFYKELKLKDSKSD
ncbi:hypothetical protein BH09BAC2_BH09BAC2_11070 [soil metagenome]